MNFDRLRDFLSQPGQRIGKYEILRKVGEGGMGVVFEAFDPDLRRPVALKVLKQADADRLRREASQAARLRHPHIVAVHEVGPDFIAMDFVAGRTLAEELPSMNRRRRTQALADIAHAVAYAHSQGVVHRDLKPSNVIVEPAGRAVLTDFGLAGLPDGTRAGTAGYRAPADVQGPAADVYSLRAIAREAGVPVSRDTAQDIARQLDSRLARRKLGWLLPIPLAGALAILLLWPQSGLDPEFRDLGVKETALTLALERDPRQVRTWVARAEVRLARTDYERNRGRNPLPDYAGAYEDFTRAIALDPVSPDLRFRRGVVLTQRAVYKIRNALDPLSDCAAAEEDLQRAGPLSAARTWLGNVRYHRGAWRRKNGQDPSADFAAAEADLTPADDSDRRMRRGRVRGALGRFDAAEEDFREAVRLAPGNVWAWTWRGKARLAAGDPAGAEAHLSRAIDSQPTFSEAWAERGSARLALGKFAPAAADFREALRLDPSLESELGPRLQEALAKSAR